MRHIESTYAELVSTLKELKCLQSIGSVMGWDERVMLPDRGTSYRAEQNALLARLCHEKFTSPRVGEMLTELAGSDLVKNPDSDAAVNVREARRTYDRQTKLPASLVVELSKTEVLAQQAWADARKNNTYKTFAPWLEKTLHLLQQSADCIGYTTTRYDALLDGFEPGETSANLRNVFESLRAPLVELVGKIGASGRPAPLDILERAYPADAQQRVAREVATCVGFDFSAGRLDVSVHPFSSGIAPGDTRITTRYDPHYFSDAFFGTLHECGHALYSQGLPTDHFGTPRGDDVSLGIHESQSRLWENLVGRSRSFWTFFLPRVRAEFPEALKDVSDDDWYRAVNDVRPSLIRTESDEATYNLHVLLRFELEQALLAGDLSVDDLPGAWNESMRKYLHVTPPDDARGCLQDIHWSGGAIGYFPTYTLGNLYAAQLFRQARADLGDLDAQFSQGHFTPLLQWLRKNIHTHGMAYTAPQLIQRITGKPLSAEPLLTHLKQKAGEVYGV